MKLSVRSFIKKIVLSVSLFALVLTTLLLAVPNTVRAQSEAYSPLAAAQPLIGVRSPAQLEGDRRARLRRTLQPFIQDYLPTLADPNIAHSAGAALQRVADDAPVPASASIVTSNEQTVDVTLVNAFSSTSLSAAVTVGAKSLPVVSSSGFVLGQQVTIDAGTAVSETVFITGITTGTLTVTALANSHASGAPVNAYDTTGAPTTPTGLYTDVTWSHNEQFLIFSAVAPGDTHYHLYVMLASGAAIAEGANNTPIYIEQLTFDNYDERYPTLLGPDDNEIAYCSDENTNSRYQLLYAPFNSGAGGYSVDQTDAVQIDQNLEAKHPFITGDTIYFAGRQNSAEGFDIYVATLGANSASISQLTGGGVADNDNPTVVNNFIAWDSTATGFTYSPGSLIPLTAMGMTVQRNIYGAQLNGSDVIPLTVASKLYSNSNPQFSTSASNDFTLQGESDLFFQSGRPVPFGQPSNPGTTHLYYYGAVYNSTLSDETETNVAPELTQVNTSDPSGYNVSTTPAGDSNLFSDEQVAVSSLVAPYVAVAYISNRYLIDHNFDNPLRLSNFHLPATVTTANGETTLATATSLTAIVPAGSTTLPVGTDSGFAVGQSIVLDSATLNSEDATITSVSTGSIGISLGTTFEHAFGATVIAINTTLTAANSAGNDTLNVTSSAGFVVGETIELDRGTTSDEFVTVRTITGNALTVTPLAFAHVSGGTVSPTPDFEPASVPTSPTSATEIFVSRLTDVDPPSLVRYNEGTEEVVHVLDGPLFNANGSTNYNPASAPSHYVKVGDTATFIVRLSDRQTGVGQAWLQIKDPNSVNQNTTHLEHKVYSEEYNPNFHDLSNEGAPAGFAYHFNEAEELFNVAGNLGGGFPTIGGSDGNKIQLGNQAILAPAVATTLAADAAAASGTLSVTDITNFTAGAIQLDYGGGNDEIVYISAITPATPGANTGPGTFAVNGPIDAHFAGEQVRQISVPTVLTADINGVGVNPPSYHVGVKSTAGLAVGDIVAFASQTGGVIPEIAEIVTIPDKTDFYVDRAIGETVPTRDENLGLYNFYQGTTINMVPPDFVYLLATTDFDPTGNEVDCEAIDTSLVANNPATGDDQISALASSYHIPDYTPGVDDTESFSAATSNNFVAAGVAPTYWLPLTPLPQNLQDNNGGTLYYGTWNTPQIGSDYYIDVVAEDASNNENWRIYDNVWGFYTKPFSPQHNILIVNDYALSQKFFKRGNHGPINYYGTESYWTDINPDVVDWTEYYQQSQAQQQAELSAGTAGPIPSILPTVAEEFSPPTANPPDALIQRTKILYGQDFGTGQTFFGTASVESYWPPYTNGLGVNSYSDGFMQHLQTYPNTTQSDYGGPDTESVAPSQEYDIWRILSRGALPYSVIQSYGAKTITQPAIPGVTVKPAIVDAPSAIVWLSPYSGDTFVGPGTITDPLTQLNLETFLNAGGRLHIEGKDIGYALTSNGSVVNTFYNQYLCDNGTTQAFVTDNIGNADGVFTLTSSATTTDLISRDAYQNGTHAFWVPAGDGGIEVTTDPSSNAVILANVNDDADQDFPNTGFARTDAAMDAAGYNDTGFIAGEVADSFIDGFTTAGNTELLGTTDREEFYQNPSTGSIVSYFSPGMAEVSQLVINYTGGPIPVYEAIDQRTDLIHNVVCALRTGTFTGSVNTTGTAGASQAGIVVSATLSGVANAPVYTAISNGAGYTIYGVPAGLYTLSGYGQGFIFQHTGIGVTVHGGDSNTVNLLITPTVNGSLQVTVVNVAGVAIPGATVSLTEFSGGQAPSPETTDAEGIAVFPNVKTGTYTVTASANGYVTATQQNVQINPTAQTAITITLIQLTSTITGTITNSQTGVGISGASVLIVDKLGNYLVTSSGTHLTTFSGAGGAYSISVPGGSYPASTQVYVEAGLTGYVNSTPALVGSAFQGQTFTNNIALVPASTLAVSVLNSITGQVIPGIEVTATGLAGTSTASDDYGPVTTAANGAVIITPIAAGSYTVAPVQSSYTTAGYASVASTTPANPETVTEGQLSSVAIDLLPGGSSITGTVTNSVTSKPIPNATVTLVNAGNAYITTANSLGVYDLVNVTPGSYTATAEATGYINNQQTVTVTASATTTQNFALEPSSGTLSGTITSSATGLPIQGATVTFISAGVQYSGTSDVNGLYTIASIPVGTYTITVAATGYVTQTPTVTIAGGVTNTNNYKLVPTTGSLTGQVTSAATGLPISGATITATVSGKTLTATSNAAGNYTLNLIPVGTYTFTASAFLYANVSESVTIIGGETATQNFVLPRAVIHSFTGGLQMFSVPYDYNNYTLSQILSGTYDATTGAQNVIATWLPLENAYVKTPTSPCDTIHDGQGYWGRFSPTGGLLYAGGTSVTNKTIALYPGWNMIGDPYISAFSLANVTVFDSTGQNQYSFANASSPTLNILNPILYTYDQGSNTYTAVSIGNPNGAANPSLEPYEGYWIEAYTNCSLKF